MTGSLQIKKDKFYMVLNLTQNGKRRQKWISTGYTVKGNKKKAEQMLRETLREYEVKEQFQIFRYVLFRCRKALAEGVCEAGG